MKSWLAFALLFALSAFVATPFAYADEEVGAGAAAASPAADPLGLSVEERNSMEKGGEKHEFQAEVNRLMDIIINSLYSNREIFLRELISNAADASDKARYEGLKDPSILGEGEMADFDIKIETDTEAKTVTITDKGIGMTKQDLVNNLGTVAKSGTTEFLDAAQSQGTENTLGLIGQFGVGFYSVYLVADRVTVVSKHHSDKQHIWESTANQDFTVAEDPRGDTLGRGTSITIHLKEDAEEFMAENKIRDIVKRHSKFVNFPVKLRTVKTESKEVPIEEEDEKKEGDTAATEAATDGDEMEVSEEEEDTDKKEEEKPKTKTVEEKIIEWERINEAKALWTRPAKEITHEEYAEFFKTLTGKGEFNEPPLAQVHFEASGEITFKSLLYIPEKAAQGQYTDLFTLKKSGVHLYVKRVLISDEFEDFLPRYMNFIRGVVDSDDLPLNVSRETLSQSRVLKVISKKLVRKILDLLKQMADAGEEQEVEEGVTADETETETEKKEKDDRYERFWEEHGKSVKFGVMDDRKNKKKLSKLLRFVTSKSEGKAVSLASYLKRMPEGQKYVYYVTGETLDKVKSSPFLEKVTAKGFEVVYMVDPLDEYVVGAMTDFEGVELASVSKEGLKLGDEDREGLKQLKEEYKPLTTWFKDTYKNAVEKVVVSNRLGNTPCVLVTGQYGWSANLQRIVQGSTLQTREKGDHMASKKVMEINVQHPIMQALNKKLAAGQDLEGMGDTAQLLLDAALLQSGFQITDFAPFNKRMARVVSAGMGLDPDAPVPEEPADAPGDDDDEDDEEKEGGGEEEKEEDEDEKDAEKAKEEL